MKRGHRKRKNRPRQRPTRRSQAETFERWFEANYSDFADLKFKMQPVGLAGRLENANEDLELAAAAQKSFDAFATTLNSTGSHQWVRTVPAVAPHIESFNVMPHTIEHGEAIVVSCKQNL